MPARSRRTKASAPVKTLSLLTIVMGTPPWLTSLPCNGETSKSFPDKKVSLAVYCRFPQPEPWFKTS